MAKLFGLDIAKLVDDNIAQAGGVLTGTLTKATSGARTPGSLTAGTNASTVMHTVRGFVETSEKLRSASNVPEANAAVSILGASVSPAAVPEVGDFVALDGGTYQLLELLERDPASALYVFAAQES